MTTSDRGITLITSFEGLALKPYKCPAGFWTIGYGTRITEALAEQWKGGITEEKALELFKAGLRAKEKAVDRRLKGPIPQYIYDELVSYAYNGGGGALDRYGITDLVNAGNYEAAAIQVAGTLYRSQGIPMSGLAKRRHYEGVRIANGNRATIDKINAVTADLYRTYWPDKRPPKS